MWRRPAAAQSCAEVVAAIGRAVVGHDALDGDAMGGEEGQRPGEEGAGAFLLLVGQDLGVGEPGGIVDADMDQVPADALLLAAAVAGDAMADAVDPAELLGVDVDQLARCGPLVADHRRLRIERRQAAETEPAQDRPDGGARQAEEPGDLRPGQALAPQPLDLGDGLGRQAVRASAGRRAPVLQAPLAARPIPRQPFVGRALRDAGRRRGSRHPPAFDRRPASPEGLDHGPSCGHSCACSSGAPTRGQVSQPKPRSQLRMNNLHSFDT